MYGVPKDISLQELVGATLIQACFGENDLILHFHPVGSISIFSQIGIGRDRLIVSESFRTLATTICDLIGEQVKAYSAKSADELELVMSSDIRLVIYDNDKSYESFTIKLSTSQIVI